MRNRNTLTLRDRNIDFTRPDAEPQYIDIAGSQYGLYETQCSLLRDLVLTRWRDWVF